MVVHISSFPPPAFLSIHVSIYPIGYTEGDWEERDRARQGEEKQKRPGKEKRSKGKGGRAGRNPHLRPVAKLEEGRDVEGLSVEWLSDVRSLSFLEPEPTPRSRSSSNSTALEHFGLFALGIRQSLRHRL